MVKIFKTAESGVLQIENFEPGCWVAMTNPTAEELHEVATRYDIDATDMRAPLDEEERSRIDVEDNYTLILVDIPTIEERNEKDWYGTIPLSIVLCNDTIITVCLEDTPVLTAFMDGRVRNFYTHMKTRFIFQILYRNATLYLNYLRIIDRRSDSIEQKLHEATRNKELIELLELEKSLVFFTTSLKANEIVLEKLLKFSAIKKYPEDQDLLDDVVVENQQAIEMTRIYRDIIQGTRELLSSLMDNRLNSAMKYLASITIVMAIPTIISGIYGMNVSEKWMPLAHTPYGFGIICVLILVACVITMKVLKKRKML
mgnify:CR=1 FL=1